MSKVDFKKTLKHLYKPSSKKFAVVDVPPMQFLMVDGEGNPNTAQSYQDAVEALYPVAYTLKFMSKNAGMDYVVPPLEGLWWIENTEEFSMEDKDAWLWTSMIMTPDAITQEMFADALTQVEEKNNPAALSKVRLETFHEGLAVQIMHIGPYAEEGPTIARLHDEFLPANGFVENGKHHEIYLSDPRRTAPEKRRTVIRQPVRKA